MLLDCVVHFCMQKNNQSTAQVRMNKDKADNNDDVTIDNKEAITSSNLNPNNNDNKISSKTGNNSNTATTRNISV